MGQLNAKKGKAKDGVITEMVKMICQYYTLLLY
jgi:hypothetical protein